MERVKVHMKEVIYVGEAVCMEGLACMGGMVRMRRVLCMREVAVCMGKGTHEQPGVNNMN